MGVHPTTELVERAKHDIEWLLTLVMDMGGADDEEDDDRMREIARRWGIEK